MGIGRMFKRRWRTVTLLACAVVICTLFVIRPWAQEPAAGWELLVQIAAVLTAGLALFGLFVPAAPGGRARREGPGRER
ncbi:hypothetical protein [Brevibacterium luteolum]|uniref:Uncharacterized protein n=1 Tax=Brevibacterium luteolum TaxID=199591 RepID=A0A849B3M1_9MICO|nr:hypothetical protein [Brevibacterium luteolum]MBM7530193.1 peptidoglycan biosynthesis protein MviN/MurJ (putative lipid II flippase) [Brevibacterium luteolum]MCT1828604.1 hypothetical protein [Brevibacterium luteolum]MCT1874193.1 hypothetical protein [Brevibacterium luteolum]MCT1891491.1 hypothetical protein [Brevibacterium luteolum]MCT1893927.1 hypothetical protein [Brevibacterium luteolum]